MNPLLDRLYVQNIHLTKKGIRLDKEKQVQGSSLGVSLFSPFVPAQYILTSDETNICHLKGSVSFLREVFALDRRQNQGFTVSRIVQHRKGEYLFSKAIVKLFSAMGRPNG